MVAGLTFWMGVARGAILGFISFFLFILTVLYFFAI